MHSQTHFSIVKKIFDINNLYMTDPGSSVVSEKIYDLSGVIVASSRQRQQITQCR